MKRKIRNELGKTSAMTEREEDNVFDVWTLSQQDRWKLYRYVCIRVQRFFSFITMYLFSGSFLLLRSLYSSVLFPSFLIPLLFYTLSIP